MTERIFLLARHYPITGKSFLPIELPRAMQTRETSESPRSFAKTSLCILAAVFLVPFIYLTSLALLLSAYVHGYSVPSRTFLKAYAVPSNVMAGAPGVGRLYSRYFEFWVKVTKADY